MRITRENERNVWHNSLTRQVGYVQSHDFVCVMSSLGREKEPRQRNTALTMLKFAAKYCNDHWEMFGQLVPKSDCAKHYNYECVRNKCMSLYMLWLLYLKVTENVL